MQAYEPELQELHLKLDTRIIKELLEYVRLARVCGTDLSALPMQVMLRIVKALMENKTELKMSFKSNDPNYRGF